MDDPVTWDMTFDNYLQIKQHIEGFGGCAESVTAFGESAGASELTLIQITIAKLRIIQSVSLHSSQQLSRSLIAPF